MTALSVNYRSTLIYYFLCIYVSPPTSSLSPVAVYPLTIEEEEARLNPICCRVRGGDSHRLGEGATSSAPSARPRPEVGAPPTVDRSRAATPPIPIPAQGPGQWGRVPPLYLLLLIPGSASEPGRQ
jgi:hypothetical protein